MLPRPAAFATNFALTIERRVMKVDKEFLIKNHFWILLFTAVGLAVVGWLLLLVTVPSTVGAEREKVQKAWDAGKNHKDFKHPQYVEKAQKEADTLNKERINIHEKLYFDQARDAVLNTWPRKMVEVGGFDFTGGKYASEIVVKAAIKPNEKKKLLNELTNDATHIHGRLLQSLSESDYVVLETKDKKQVKILKTPTVKVTDEGAKEDAKKTIDFPRLTFSEMDDRILSVTFDTGKYFAQEMSDAEIAAFVETYKDQLADALAEAGPLNALGEPIVQFRYTSGDGAGGFGKGSGMNPAGASRPKGGFSDAAGGGPPGAGKGAENDPPEEDAFGPETWIFRPGKLPPPQNRFFSYVPKWDKNLSDISDEIWAAQENLWIQRELFKRVKLANDAVARFTPADPKAHDAKQAAKVLGTKDQWHKFSNFYWELELKVSGEGVLAKFKNLRPRRQSLDGLHFLVKFSATEAPLLFPPKGVTLDTTPLPPDKSWATETPIAMPAGTKLEGVFAIDQVLTWETAAIKRIEVVSIGLGASGDPAVSQRQAWMPLVPFKKKKEEPVAPDAGKDDGGLKGPGKFGLSGVPGGAAANQATGFGKHGVLLDRYLEVTPELRKVPINLVLIVDPDHIAKVEKTFAESPLRFLTTQVMWQRCAVALRPQEPSTSTTGVDKSPPTGPFNKGKGMLPGPGGFGGDIGGFGQPGPESSAGEEQENLELTIYGVITLYDRPGRPAPTPEQPK
jgi:hypothetical protein